LEFVARLGASTEKLASEWSFENIRSTRNQANSFTSQAGIGRIVIFIPETDLYNQRFVPKRRAVTFEGPSQVKDIRQLAAPITGFWICMEWREGVPCHIHMHLISCDELSGLFGEAFDDFCLMQQVLESPTAKSHATSR
jgi:hypothetical protein